MIGAHSLQLSPDLALLLGVPMILYICNAIVNIAMFASRGERSMGALVIG